MDSPYEDNYGQMENDQALVDPETDILNLDDDILDKGNDELLDIDFQKNEANDGDVDGDGAEAEDEEVEAEVRKPSALYLPVIK